MRWALSRKSREVLRRFMTSDVLLAFDFDGTLAPIVNDPDRARMRFTTRRLLRRLAGAALCVVISGRSRADVRNKLVGTGVRHVIGNHGAEPWERAAETALQVARWNAALVRNLPVLPGLRIENKKMSVTLHYRQCRWRTRARSEILRVARLLPEVRLIGGKEAVSLVSKNAPSKGTALRRELSRWACDRALYVGDDETDEDVFSLSGDPRLLTIRVGRKRNSAAQYFLRNQPEIDDLLRCLYNCELQQL